MSVDVTDEGGGYGRCLVVGFSILRMVLIVPGCWTWWCDAGLTVVTTGTLRVVDMVLLLTLACRG